MTDRQDSNQETATAGDAMRRYRWHPKIATRTLDGAAFILLGSRMLSLNEVGTCLWQSFERGATIEQACTEVVASFEAQPEQVRKDATQFIDQLLERGMLVAS